MNDAVMERAETHSDAWEESETAEESAERMAQLAAKLQESQPTMSLKTLFGLVFGAVQGKSHRSIKL